jgi:hypothetical protein
MFLITFEWLLVISTVVQQALTVSSSSLTASMLLTSNKDFSVNIASQPCEHCDIAAMMVYSKSI